MNQLMTSNIKMTSLDIAEIVGKEHKNVMRDIRNESESLGPEVAQLIFEPSTYLDKNNQERPCYTFGKDGAMQLALKYDAKTRFRVIKRIEEMEKQLIGITPPAESISTLDERIEQASKLLTLLRDNQSIVNSQVNEAIQAQVYELIAGEKSPKTTLIEGKWYLTSEIAELAGVTTQLIAALASRHGLREAPYYRLTDPGNRSGLVQAVYSEVGKDKLVELSHQHRAKNQKEVN